MTTLDRRLVRGDGTGYRAVVPAPGEPHETRTELAELPSGRLTPLLTLAHLSDLHVCDAQSPARVEYLDRWADPDSPVVDITGNVGSYRPQEPLTAQVVEAMVRAVNAVAGAPVGGAAVDLAIVTGDNTDNAQANELAWYLALLEGGPVCADSGDLTRWQGITALGSDGRFWHPDGDVADRPRSSYGFPTVPGMFDAVRRPFAATGLAMPWLAVHGNHDRLLQGTVPAAEVFARVAVGDRKGIGLADDWSADEVVALLTGLAECEPAALARLGEARTATVTADPSRRPVSRAEFVAAHFGPGARPVGHGFGDDQRRSGDAYYRHDREGVTLLVLDTVDEHGGWQGSLDRAQFDWLQGQLAAADAEQRLVVLASHHPLDDLVNAAGPSRVLGGEIAHLLTGHRCVVLWLNGHSHTTTVTARRTFWEVTTPSLIDRPQHARLVELLRAGDRLVVATTMVDHVGEAPWSGAIDSPTALAGLSRELAANDWQQVIGEPSGTARDRNVLLPLRDPFAS